METDKGCRGEKHAMMTRTHDVGHGAEHDHHRISTGKGRKKKKKSSQKKPWRRPCMCARHMVLFRMLNQASQRAKWGRATAVPAQRNIRKYNEHCGKDIHRMRDTPAPTHTPQESTIPHRHKFCYHLVPAMALRRSLIDHGDNVEQCRTRLGSQNTLRACTL
jgi:hypothetical protein